MSFCCSALFALCNSVITNFFPPSSESSLIKKVHVVDTPLDYVVVCVYEEDAKECQRFVDKLNAEVYFDNLMRSGACIACSALGQCPHREFMEGPPVFPNLDRSSTQSIDSISCTSDQLFENVSLEDVESEGSKDSLLSKIDEIQRTLMDTKKSMELYYGRTETASSSQLDKALAQLITDLNDMLDSTTCKEHAAKLSAPGTKLMEEGIETTACLIPIVSDAVETEAMNLLGKISMATNYSSLLEGGFGRQPSLLSRSPFYLSGLAYYI